MVVTATLLAWAASYAFAAGLLALRRAPTHGGDTTRVRRVLLVRPFTGDDQAAAMAMATQPICPAGISLRWRGCAADVSDPAWPVLGRCVETLRRAGVDAEATITGARGPNYKADQLGIATHDHDADAIVVVDADVDLASVDLDALLRPLMGCTPDGRRVGVVWSPPIEPWARSPADRVSRAILGGSWHAFGLLARLDPHLIVGKTFAIHRDALAAIGGFGPLREHLGEDFELGRRCEAAGFAIACTPRPVHSRAKDRRFTTVFQRYVRWLWVVRAQRPGRLLAYPLLLAAAPLLLLAGLATWASSPWAAGIIVATTIASRAGVTVMAARQARLRIGPRLLLDAWLADLVLLAVFARVGFGRRVRWANRTLRIGADGRLQTAAE